MIPLHVRQSYWSPDPPSPCVKQSALVLVGSGAETRMQGVVTPIKAPVYRAATGVTNYPARGGGGGGGGGSHSHRLYSHSCDRSRSMVNDQSRPNGCSQWSKRLKSTVKNVRRPIYGDV